MSKLKFIRAAMLAVVALASSVVMAQTAPVNGETVRIQEYPGVVSMLAIVTVERGYCNKYGINCELIPLPSAVVGLQALLSGGLDVATPAVETALQLAAKGTPVRFIGNTYRNSPYEFAVGDQVSGPNQQKGFPAMMRDFKGKKIGVTTRGAGPEYVLKSMLDAAGMKESDVTVVAVGGPNTSYPALVNKQIDAVVSFEPMGAFCEVLKTCRIALWLSKGEGPKELTLLAGAYVPMVVRADYAEKNPKVIVALRSAFKDAETFIQSSSNFDELMRIAKKYYKIDNPRADELIATTLHNSIPSFYSELDPKALQAASDYMLRTGQLSKPLDTSGLVLR